MTIAILIVVAVFVGLAVAFFFQMKAARKHADLYQQLMKDYQDRINEQEKLQADYRELEKNFDNVGEGYDQALLAFEKMEEDNKKYKSANEQLDAECADLRKQCAQQQETIRKARETIGQTLEKMRDIAKANSDWKLQGLIGKITDVEDVELEDPIQRTDNILMSQIAGEAIGISGIDKVSYLKFDLQIAPDAAATMLSTKLTKAVRALTHLLDNAMKFTPEGSVTLRVTVDMMAMKAFFTVEDNGSGIDVADAERIFEPYVKLNQYFDGQGIGLAVARGIARRLGGDVTYAPASQGVGSTFMLTLPI